MNPSQQSLVPWFRGSFYIGLFLLAIAGGALALEMVRSGNWYVESLIGQLGIGLLFLYFSGRPMIDERIRLLKFKALASAFAFTALAGTLANYLITYPDGNQSGGLSSYTFVLVCLVLAFAVFYYLSARE